MRRKALALLAWFLLAGCLKLLGVECEDECLVATRQCSGTDVELCVMDALITGCTVWVTDHECAKWGAVCVAAACECPPPTVLCGACVDLATNPAHCGACEVSCGSGTCADGVCVPAPAGDAAVEDPLR